MSEFSQDDNLTFNLEHLHFSVSLIETRNLGHFETMLSILDPMKSKRSKNVILYRVSDGESCSAMGVLNKGNISEQIRLGIICRYNFHYIDIEPNGYLEVAIDDLGEEREVQLQVGIKASNAYNYS